jgi:glycosyltransferase involved in cell wall biosynthesis
MNTPAVSVVVPAYNAARTIRETLKALSVQTVRDWECIVVDDGSTDLTAQTVSDCLLEDTRIRLVMQANGGVSRARNTGLARARGRIIAFLDADDIWYPNYLEQMTAKLDSDPAIGIAFSRVRIVDLHGKPTGAETRSKLTGITVPDLINSNPTTTCSNLVVRREVFYDAGDFPVGMNHAEDQLWLLQVHLAGWKIEGVNRILLDYRTSPNGLSANLEAMLQGWDVLAAFARSRLGPQIEPTLKRARAEYLRYLARRALWIHARTSVALRYMLRALAQDWRMALHAPWPTIPLVGAACFDACAGLATLRR